MKLVNDGADSLLTTAKKHCSFELEGYFVVGISTDQIREAELRHATEPAHLELLMIAEILVDKVDNA